MAKKVLYCTIDTETVGGAMRPTGTYNLGAVIHDKDGNIFATLSLLIMEHYNEIPADDYAKNNFHIYQERMASGVISCVATESDAENIIRNLCRAYGVKYIMAYNSAFDFCKTFVSHLLDEFEFIDLYLMAMQTVIQQRSYSKFCHAHGFKSSSGKSVATSAESVYAFISKNPDHIEEHTALSDALEESAIFVRCMKTHRRFTKNCHRADCKGDGFKFPKWDKDKGEDITPYMRRKRAAERRAAN